MASIKSSRAKTYGTRTFVAEGEAPEHGPSEGEILVKQMVKKQMETEVTLNQQLSESKEFEKATEFESATKYFSGQATLEEFIETASKVEQNEVLRTFGLTNEEIQLLLDHNKGKDYLAQKYKNVDRSILDSQLEGIHNKIQEAKKIKKLAEEETLSKNLSRHSQELIKSVQHASEHSRLYQFALLSQPSTSVDSRPLTHPINQLKDIEQELFGHLAKKSRTSKNKRSKKKIKTDDCEEALYEQPIDKSECTIQGRRSLWDVTTTVTKQPSQKHRKERAYSCKPEVLYTIRDKKIVPLIDNSCTTISTKSSAEEATISGAAFVISNAGSLDSTNPVPTKQLSVDQIKELPRFANYDQGSPSMVLFIKNLHNRVQEEDLVTLFRQYETSNKPRIIYRLMRGKMQGQAFVTFSDIDTAVIAMNSTNGTYLCGKPIVIQYGKSSTHT